MIHQLPEMKHPRLHEAISSWLPGCFGLLAFVVLLVADGVVAAMTEPNVARFLVVAAVLDLVIAAMFMLVGNGIHWLAFKEKSGSQKGSNTQR